MTVTFDVSGVDDVTGIDLHLHDDQTLAAYLVTDESPVLVEPGHAVGGDRLRTGLDRAGVDPAAIDATICSHVHLDHAGGAAGLATAAPDLRVLIHEATADHLIDPDRLVASSRNIMGEAFAEVGAPDPLDMDRLDPVGDEGTTIKTGNRTLELVHSPGHAPDHLAVWDETTGTLFAGESFGNYWPKADQWLPPATLPQFDPDIVRETLSTLRALNPNRICLSHFGVRSEPEHAFDAAETVLDRFEAEIPRIYREQDEDLEMTEEIVEAELLDLDDYAAPLIAMQRRVQTRGFLQGVGLL